ncbi:DUF4232 domain-containing protein [Streptomyces sp. NRRL F-5123]|uniref:DUF4232 domain-containing protein n=1 Tax=Streptomyces sp. NRRL F-5123 TaxID=1463856 RepID=UPI00069336FD|nr:DUF4232 domain-containing protein [Streptomyces sp. NRRL F-5123]
MSRVLAGAAVAAVLTAAGCRPDGADSKGTDRPSDRSGTATSAQPSGPDTAVSTAPGRNTETDGDDDTGEQAPACGQDDLTSSAANEDGQGREPRHLLLVLTNTGDRTCAVHGYPQVRLGTYSKSPVEVIEDSDPGAPAVLSPGDDVYAALLVNGARTDTYETKGITLRLQGDKPGSTAGGPISVTLPAVASFDEGARVTYWTTAQGYALDFVMSR